jgi:hypothetical protein
VREICLVDNGARAGVLQYAAQFWSLLAHVNRYRNGPKPRNGAYHDKKLHGVDQEQRYPIPAANASIL